MKKLVSAAIVAALVAGTASAEVKLSANARVRSNLYKGTMAKESDYNRNDWLNLKGNGDAADTVSIKANEDFGGLEIVTSINATNNATNDSKSVNNDYNSLDWANFDTYKAWLQFGSFKLTGGRFATRNSDRIRN